MNKCFLFNKKAIASSDEPRSMDSPQNLAEQARQTFNFLFFNQLELPSHSTAAPTSSDQRRKEQPCHSTSNLEISKAESSFVFKLVHVYSWTYVPLHFSVEKSRQRTAQSISFRLHFKKSHCSLRSTYFPAAVLRGNMVRCFTLRIPLTQWLPLSISYGYWKNGELFSHR